MAVQITQDQYVFIFDSNRPASTILTNALGEISADQLRDADRLAQALGTTVTVVAFHHQLHLPSHTANLAELITDHALTLINARDVFEWLATHSKIIALHGHRHFAHESTYCDGRVSVISSRSTTLGDPRQCLPPAIRRFRVEFTGTRLITACDTIELSS